MDPMYRTYSASVDLSECQLAYCVDTVMKFQVKPVIFMTTNVVSASQE
jgi:hypothetical protein